MAAPDLPIIGTATATGTTTATVGFAAPLDDGGSTITSYTATSNPGNISVSGTVSPITVTGLEPNTTYTFTVTATNGDGTSGPSSPSNSITTFSSVPDAPTIGTATKTGATTATVAFNPPLEDGGEAITVYTATSLPGSITATNTSSPINFTGLTSGTEYTFTVTATNAVGTSAPSQASNTITTDYINPNSPGAPTIGTATKTGSTTATVAFTAPSSDGGYPITGYTAISTPGGITGTGTTSPITVTGLNPGQEYTFVVFATNSQGAGLNSSASNTITTDPEAPGAPTIGTATKTGSTTAVVTFTEPTNNGGAAVTSYTVTSNPDNVTATGNGSPITVTGLTPATSYTFTVTATNIAGTSVPSGASNQITADSTVPGAPTIGAATILTSTSARVAFTAPANNGGASITGYTVTSTPGNIVASGTSSPITVLGLTPATSYTFKIVASNFVGDSAESAESNSITTPAADVFVPDAPTIGTATKTGSTTATLAFTAPANNGGAAIIGYIGTSTPGGIIASSTSSPMTFTGLTPATHYTFVVRAVNIVGSGPNSDSSNVINTDSAPPGPPTVGTAAKTGATTATLAFTPPTVTNGQTIIGYTVDSTPIGGTGSGTTSPILVTGLTPATAYRFKIRAVTSVNTQGEESAFSNIITTDFGSAANYATLANQIDTIKAKINALSASTLNAEQILYLSKSILILSEALGVDDIVDATANAITQIDNAGAATITLVSGTANGVAVSNLSGQYNTLQAAYDNINPRVTSLEGVITNQESNIATASALAASAGYNPWQVISSNKLLVNRDRIFVNTPSGGGGVGGLTLTLPAGPSIGFVVEIVDISGNASTNFFTIARNGERIQGLEEDLIFNVNNKAMKLIYSNTAKGWRLA